MYDTEPIYLKRPILAADCLALARIARLCGDKSITPIELQWHIKNTKAQSLLYEHEIDGVAHPVAWCLYEKSRRHRTLLTGPMFCHLEYDGTILYQLMLGHIMRLVSPKYPTVTLDGIESTNAELIQAATGLGFWNVANTVCGGKTWLEFRYGVEQ